MPVSFLICECFYSILSQLDIKMSHQFLKTLDLLLGERISETVGIHPQRIRNV